MKLVRPVVALAALGCIAGGVTAQAATPKPTCNLITDPAGDANDPTTAHAAFGGPNPVPNNAHTDVVGGDISSTAKSLTVKIKLASAPSVDPTSPQGDYFYFTFTPSGAANPVYLLASGSSTLKFTAGAITTDTTGATNYTDNSSVPVKGKVDGSTITMSVKLSDLKPLANVKQGAKITDLSVFTAGVIEVPGVTGLLIDGDHATADKNYTAGAPSCLKQL